MATMGVATVIVEILDYTIRLKRTHWELLHCHLNGYSGSCYGVNSKQLGAAALLTKWLQWDLLQCHLPV